MQAVVSSFLIIFGIVGIIYMIDRIDKKAKKDILDTLFKNDEITSEVYKKYLDK